MECPECKKEMVQSNLADHEPDDLGGFFFREYYCFRCNTLYVCSSQSGDYVEEYLDVVEV